MLNYEQIQILNLHFFILVTSDLQVHACPKGPHLYIKADFSEEEYVIHSVEVEGNL